MRKRVFSVENFAQPAFLQVLGTRPDVELTTLRKDASDTEAAAVISAAHAYHVSSGVNEIERKYLASAELLARAPKLLLVSTMGAGYDTVDVPACTRMGVAVVNQGGGGNAQAVAEHVLAMMLCLSKRIIQADRRMRRQPGVNRHDFVGRNSLGKTVGIIGFGNVGRCLAELCRAALHMRVLVCDPYRDAETVAARGCEKSPLERLLAGSDFVVVCCSLTAETRGMMGPREFSLMQERAYFISAARGGIHDEEALAEALRTRRIAGAGIDVWDVEPPPPGHPLLQMDNVLASPHIAGATIESRTQAAEAAARQVLDVFEGKRPPRLLNPQAWPLFSTRFEREFGFRPESIELETREPS